MRRLLTATALMSAFLSPPVAAQGTPPFRIGAHVAGNLMNGPFDFVRVGVQLMVPLENRLYGYPAVSRFVDGARWEVSGALRYHPFGPSDRPSSFYAGAGWAGIDFGPGVRFYDQLLMGLEIPVGRLRPYVELQLLGGVHRLVNEQADWGVQAYSGLTWAVR